MACCGKNIKLPPEQQKILDEINRKRRNSGVKSNRSPAGTIAKQCPKCGTKTIVSICPICFTSLVS